MLVCVGANNHALAFVPLLERLESLERKESEHESAALERKESMGKRSRLMESICKRSRDDEHSADDNTYAERALSRLSEKGIEIKWKPRISVVCSRCNSTIYQGDLRVKLGTNGLAFQTHNVWAHPDCTQLKVDFERIEAYLRCH